MEALKNAQIGTGIHYPIPLHLQKAYAFLNYREGDFPVTEKVAAEIVSLPMFPQLTLVQQERVTAAILRFFRGRLAASRAAGPISSTRGRLALQRCSTAPRALSASLRCCMSAAFSPSAIEEARSTGYD